MSNLQFYEYFESRSHTSPVFDLEFTCQCIQNRRYNNLPLLSLILNKKPHIAPSLAYIHYDEIIENSFDMGNSKHVYVLLDCGDSFPIYELDIDPSGEAVWYRDGRYGYATVTKSNDDRMLVDSYPVLLYSTNIKNR